MINWLFECEYEFLYLNDIQILQMSGDFSAEFDGETARLCIQHVYPEDEGEYTCVAYNDLGKAFTSACLIVDGNFDCSIRQTLRGKVAFVFEGTNDQLWKRMKMWRLIWAENLFRFVWIRV